MSDDAAPASADGATSTPPPDHGKPEDTHRGADSAKKDGDRAPDDDSGFRDSTSSSARQGSYNRPPQFQADVMASVTGGESQRVYVGNTYYYAARVVTPAAGPVPTELLETVRERYVKVSGYPNLVASLRKRGLLILGGAPTTGRSFTALHLLDRLAKGNVLTQDANTDVCTLGADDLESGSGYLSELAEGAAMFDVNQAHRLADLLQRHDCYLVVVVTGDQMRSEAFIEYGLKCPPPDVNKLLDQYLYTQLKPTDPEDLKDKLTALAAEPSLQAARGTNPSVAETVKFAQLLLAYGRDEVTLQQVELDCHGFVKHQVIEWFGPLPRATRYDVTEYAIRLAGFRLALAVLNEMPRTVVTDAGEDLVFRIVKTAYPKRKPGRLLFADPDVMLLDLMRARTAERPFYYGSGSVPVSVLGFQDDRYPQTVLSHVWQQHHNLRLPLISWLKDLAQDPRSYVRECAAQAAGVLCWVDFPGAFNQLIWPAACTEPPENRAEPAAWWDWSNYLVFAALALDQASHNERLRIVIEGILKGWRRHGTHSERCTAGIAHGYLAIRRSVDTSLEELRVIGTPQELDDRTPNDEATLKTKNFDHGDLIWAAGRSIALLFATGARHAILTLLSHWVQRRYYPERRGHPSRESLRRLALHAIILMADLKVSALSERQITGTRSNWISFSKSFEERRKWPLLLAILDDDPSLTNSIAFLLRQTLRSTVRKTALEKLDSWMEAAQADPACADVLVRLLPSLVENESDRARLLDHVRRRRLAWADALRPEIAEQLTTTLEHSSNGKGKCG